MTTSHATPATIGVFDSGIGGLSVLQALRGRLPDAALHYLADSAWAPYGDRSVDEVIQRSMLMCERLLEAGARMIVVACNTATTVAIGGLRERWPGVPFVGVEPGVKPAAGLTRNGRIGVLATRRTIASARLKALVDDHARGCDVLLQACPGLADAIERGTHDDAAMFTMIDGFCAPLRAARVDTVVLGCTHYPFVAHLIRRSMGADVLLVDTAHAVALRAQTLWTPFAATSSPGELLLETTGNARLLARFATRWLDATPGLAAATADHVGL